MRLFNTGSALVLALALVSPTAAFAGSPAPVKQASAGAKTAKTKTLGDFPTPRAPKPRRTVTVEAFGEQRTVIHRPPTIPVDPYRLTATGHNDGTQFELAVQRHSAPLDLPAGQVDAPAKGQRPARGLATAADVTRAVARAQRYQVVSSGTMGVHATETPVEGYAPWTAPAGSAVVVGPEVLARGVGFRVTAPSPTKAGRKLGGVAPTRGGDGHVAGGTITGLPTEVQTRQDTTMVPRYRGSKQLRVTKVGPEYKLERSGRLAPAGVPWVQPANLLATPSYSREGGSFTKVLGLAAFPRGAEISYVNQSLYEEALAAGTPRPTAGNLGHAAASASGSAGIKIPGRPGDRISLVVKLPGPDAGSHTRRVQFTIPNGAGTPVIAKRGRAYFPVEDVVTSER